ncbi:MAG: DUF1292 domain-containing protein [Lachnospiraceae bacterium]|nr:DUF1292 domain-containing protein [Lachnospiraceae bacterium]
MQSLEFRAEDGTVEKFYVEADTRVNGVSYILVSDADEDSEEANALILKDVSGDSSEEAEYVIVEDDVELQALLKVFSEILDDTDIDL